MYSKDNPGQEGFAFLSGVAIDDASTTVMITYGAGDLDPRVLVIPLEKFDAMFVDQDADLLHEDTEGEEEDQKPRSDTSRLSGLFWIFLLFAWIIFLVSSGKISCLLAAQQRRMEELIRLDERKAFLESAVRADRGH